MKTYKKILMSLGVAALTLSSCDTKFDKINTDPNRPTEVHPTGVLTALQRNTAFEYYNSWSGIRMNGVTSQHWSQRVYTEEDRYDFSKRTSSITNYFTYAYRMIELANKIIEINEKDPVAAAVYGDNTMQIASAKIYRMWLMELVVGTFGDVPYFETNKINSILQPKYDKQDVIMKDMIAELKKINTDLKTVKKGWTNGDVVFNGNVEKWSKFANSLRLRLAMRLSNYDPALSRVEAELALTDGVMESNEDNATFYFTGSGAPNQAPHYGDYDSRNDFVPTWQFTNMLLGNDDPNKGFINPFNGISDPRLAQIVASPNYNNDTNPEKPAMKTEGMPYGLSNSDNGAVWTAIAKTRIAYGPTKNKVDATLPKPIQASFWSTIIDYTNVALYIAELRNNDRASFKSGVEASLSMWGVPYGDALSYVNNVMTKFDAADANGKYEMIITQKYIHNFAHCDHEALFEYRRTELPKMLVLPGEQSGPEYTVKVGEDEAKNPIYAQKTFKFVPADGSKNIIQRMMYPNTEFTANKQNVESAVQSMGGDDQTIPLIYSKRYVKQ